MDEEKTLLWDEMKAHVEDAIAMGLLPKNPRVYIHTGWEGREHLPSKVKFCLDNGGVRYVLLCQP